MLRKNVVFSEWIIESPELFAEYVQELYVQCGKGEGRFVLSKDESEMDLPKAADMIMSPLGLDLNERKIINKLYSELVKVSASEVMYERTAELTRYISDYIMDLEDSANYAVQFSDRLDIVGLLKAMDVKYEEIEESLLEHLIRYIKLVVELLGVKLIIFVNLRSYLSDRQFSGLIQEIKYQEIKALFIENQEKACIEGGMRYIIDKDGCEIY